MGTGLPGTWVIGRSHRRLRQRHRSVLLSVECVKLDAAIKVTELIVVSHLRTQKKLLRLPKKKKRPKKITPFHSYSILFFPPHDFASLIFKDPGETFAWCSKRRVEKVMLTFGWLDAECHLVEYEQGRIQLNKVGMVFSRADERNSKGVEGRSTVIYKFGERFACGNPISRILN